MQKVLGSNPWVMIFFWICNIPSCTIIHMVHTIIYCQITVYHGSSWWVHGSSRLCGAVWTTRLIYCNILWYTLIYWYMHCTAWYESVYHCMSQYILVDILAFHILSCLCTTRYVLWTTQYVLPCSLSMSRLFLRPETYAIVVLSTYQPILTCPGVGDSKGTLIHLSKHKYIL